MNTHDLFDWVNAAAGGVGLLLTVLAIVQATGAKKAAERAEKGVQRHNAEVDFSTLVRMARELHGYVESGSMHEARLRTTDLRIDLAVALKRHEAFLGLRAGDLRVKLYDLKLIADGLNRAPGEVTDSERIRLPGISGAILDLLAGQSGELQLSAESEAGHG
jgi:hypothetical protein